MPVQGGQVWKFERVLVSPSTFQPLNADSLPLATLVLNGVDNATAVTVANAGTGLYTFSVTLPALVPGDVVQIRVSAVYAGLTYAAIVAMDSAYTTISPSTSAVSSLGGTFFNLLLQFLLQNINIPNFGDPGGLRGSVGAGSLYVGLATADPGIAGTQLTNETTYGSYVRQAIVRSASGFSVSGLVGSNANQVLFPAATSGADTITFATVGTQLTGAGLLVARCPLSANFGITTGVQPRFPIGTLTITAA